MFDSAQSMAQRASIAGKLRAISGAQLLSAGVTLSAIILLVGTGSSVITRIVQPDGEWSSGQRIAEVLLLLNIALFLLSAHRYRDLEAEVRESRAAEASARAHAERDALTGLYNRRALQLHGRHHLAKWRQEGLRCGALIVDLDSFKSINDLFGHAEGDNALAASAVRLVEAVPPQSLVARIGGDEFAVLTPFEGDSADQLDALGRRLVASIGRPVAVAGVDLPVSCSVGGAMDAQDALDLQSLLDQADDAMYQAKGRGRNRYCAFTPAMAEAMVERDSLETNLRRALLVGGLHPVYEPIIDLKTGTPIAFEMLARWQCPTLGVVPPSTFIKVAEEAGLIGCLTEHLVTRAMQDARSWPADISLSVNISPVQLKDPWLAQKLIKAAVENGFVPSRLILEITESALIDNLEMARTTFESLRNQGIRIALDDFGSGYASFGHVRDLAFDIVKIDRDYVATLLRGEEDGNTARALVQLCQTLGRPVIAEGVENIETAEHLARLNCTFAQGRLYGYSLLAEDVAEHLSPATGSGFATDQQRAASA